MTGVTNICYPPPTDHTGEGQNHKEKEIDNNVVDSPSQSYLGTLICTGGERWGHKQGVELVPCARMHLFEADMINMFLLMDKMAACVQSPRCRLCPSLFRSSPLAFTALFTGTVSDPLTTDENIRQPRSHIFPSGVCWSCRRRNMNPQKQAH